MAYAYFVAMGLAGGGAAPREASDYAPPYGDDAGGYCVARDEGDYVRAALARTCGVVWSPVRLFSCAIFVCSFVLIVCLVGCF